MTAQEMAARVARGIPMTAREAAYRIVQCAWWQVSGDLDPRMDAVSAKLHRIMLYLSRREVAQ